MGEISVVTFTREQARTLTDEVKRDAETLWRKLAELYDGGAHIALGYSSWGDYFTTEFGQSRAQGYRLLDAGRVLDVLRESPIGDWYRANEAQARELAPLREDPGGMVAVVERAKEKYGDPTAAELRELVTAHLQGNRAAFLNDDRFKGLTHGKEDHVDRTAAKKLGYVPVGLPYEFRSDERDEVVRIVNVAADAYGCHKGEALLRIVREWGDRMGPAA